MVSLNNGWLHQLYETYEQCSQKSEFMSGEHPLLPICHTTQNAHIEIALDGKGHFLTAKVIEKGKLTTIVPCTEASAGRSGSKPVNHPLCDKLQYVAGDYLDYGGTVTSGFKKHPEEPHQNYLTQLSDWATSEYTHPKVSAIHHYIKQSTLIADLVKTKCLHVDDDGKLIKQWKLSELYETQALNHTLGQQQYDELIAKLKQEDNTKKRERVFGEYAPSIFKTVPTGQTVEASLVRWRIETPGNQQATTWDDQSLFRSWINIYSQREARKDVCMVTGENTAMASQHPSGIRHGADKAKLISSNDSSGFTFRGRFTDKAGEQACTVSADVTQKAHNALRWLVQRKQAYRFGDQVFVSWAVSGENTPDAFGDTDRLWGDEDTIIQNTPVQHVTTDIGDAGLNYAIRLKAKIAGYSTNISDTDRIIIMGLDSATPGRMAVTYYRVFSGSEFLQRLEHWHKHFAWHQNFSKDKKFIGAPAPRDIAEAAYGRRLDDKLKKSTAERLLPCIIDQNDFPLDLLESCLHRVANRVGMEKWEWEKVLGITCALYRGKYQKESFSMGLEEDRTNRNYLYGRLLAVADYIETIALIDSEKNRPTNAAKMMQRFSNNPAATWSVIHDQLRPYVTRLKSSPKTAGRLLQMEILLSNLSTQFETVEAFNDPSPLTGEYLLAYYCQRKELWKSNKEKETNTSALATKLDD